MPHPVLSLNYKLGAKILNSNRTRKDHIDIFFHVFLLLLLTRESTSSVMSDPDFIFFFLSFFLSDVYQQRKNDLNLKLYKRDSRTRQKKGSSINSSKRRRRRRVHSWFHAAFLHPPPLCSLRASSSWSLAKKGAKVTFLVAQSSSPHQSIFFHSLSLIFSFSSSSFAFDLKPHLKLIQRLSCCCWPFDHTPFCKAPISCIIFLSIGSLVSNLSNLISFLDERSFWRGTTSWCELEAAGARSNSIYQSTSSLIPMIPTVRTPIEFRHLICCQWIRARRKLRRGPLRCATNIKLIIDVQLAHCQIFTIILISHTTNQLLVSTSPPLRRVYD